MTLQEVVQAVHQKQPTAWCLDYDNGCSNKIIYANHKFLGAGSTHDKAWRAALQFLDRQPVEVNLAEGSR